MAEGTVFFLLVVAVCRAPFYCEWNFKKVWHYPSAIKFHSPSIKHWKLQILQFSCIEKTIECNVICFWNIKQLFLHHVWIIFLFGAFLQRVNQCLHNACLNSTAAVCDLKFLDCGEGNNVNMRMNKINEKLWGEWRVNANATQCFYQNSDVFVWNLQYRSKCNCFNKLCTKICLFSFLGFSGKLKCYSWWLCPL